MRDAAAYMLSHEDEVVDAPYHEFLTQFSDAQEQLIDEIETFSEAGDALNTWISKMFDILNSSAYSLSSLRSLNNVESNSLGYVPISVPELRDIMESLMLFSNVSATQHLLGDTGFPRSIYSKDWL